MQNKVGDGTTSAVLLAIEFLSEAEKLLDMKMHPSTIIQGLFMASEKAVQLIRNELSFSPSDIKLPKRPDTESGTQGNHLFEFGGDESGQDGVESSFLGIDFELLVCVAQTSLYSKCLNRCRRYFAELGKTIWMLVIDVISCPCCDIYLFERGNSSRCYPFFQIIL
jgi:chaperonin GroEL (HSP60 family)